MCISPRHQTSRHARRNPHGWSLLLDLASLAHMPHPCHLRLWKNDSSPRSPTTVSRDDESTRFPSSTRVAACGDVASLAPFIPSAPRPIKTRRRDLHAGGCRVARPPQNSAVGRRWNRPEHPVEEIHADPSSADLSTPNKIAARTFLFLVWRRGRYLTLAQLTTLNAEL